MLDVRRVATPRPASPGGALGVVLLVAAVLLAGCESSPSRAGARWLDAPTAELPPTLDAVGLFPARTSAGALDREVLHERAIEVTPRFPLWTNGSDKSRHLVLPAGGQIDATGEPWGWPLGTAIFKTFTYGGQALETRVLWLTEEGWDYGLYHWSDDGSDATLSEMRAPEVVDAPGAGHAHTLPSRLQCRKCHEAAPSHVLGLGALQLADQLETLSAAGVFSTAPATPAAIDTGSELTDAVVGYAQGNCVHCHNGGDGINNGYDMRPEVFVAHTVGAEAVGYSAAVPLRVDPGVPSASLLWLVLSGETDDPEVEDMPPLGVDVRDQQAADLVHAWITSLPAP